MAKAVLVDLTRCTGCRGCQVACKEWNERLGYNPGRETKQVGTYTNPPHLDSETYTHIRFVEGESNGTPVWSFVKDQCLHCDDPACVAVCPVHALQKSEAGPVTYNYDVCIGCRYCLLGCPFNIPKYEWEKTLPAVQKCTFCSERIKDGMVPACIKTCPTGTMLFGDREEVLREARNRLSTGNGRYEKRIYGEKEAGGTSWLYLSAMPFGELGFRDNVPKQNLPPLTWAYIKKIPFVIPAIIVGGTLSWFMTRKDEIQEKEGTS